MSSQPVPSDHQASRTPQEIARDILETPIDEAPIPGAGNFRLTFGQQCLEETSSTSKHAYFSADSRGENLSRFGFADHPQQASALYHLLHKMAGGNTDMRDADKAALAHALYVIKGEQNSALLLAQMYADHVRNPRVFRHLSEDDESVNKAFEPNQSHADNASTSEKICRQTAKYIEKRITPLIRELAASLHIELEEAEKPLQLKAKRILQADLGNGLSFEKFLEAASLVTSADDLETDERGRQDLARKAKHLLRALQKIVANEALETTDRLSVEIAYEPERERDSYRVLWAYARQVLEPSYLSNYATIMPPLLQALQTELKPNDRQL